MTKLKTFILFVILSLAATGFYFWSAVKDLSKNVSQKFEAGLEDVKKINQVNIARELKREVLTSSPLRVDGPKNQATLAREKIIAETNIQRFNHGLPPLIENVQLNNAATAKARDMFDNQYFDHVSPAGLGPGEIAKFHGYDYIIVGENLILGNFASEKEMIQAWMNSPPHKENILNERFQEIGAAVIEGIYEGQTVWIGAQEFGLHISVCRTPNDDLRNQIEENKSRLESLEKEINVKKSEIENTKLRPSERNELVNEYNRLVADYNNLSQQTKNLAFIYNQETDVFNQCVTGS